MSILGFLFLVFVFYLGYRLLFDFIIPVFRTTRQIKKGFRDMHQQMNQHAQQYNQQKQQNQPNKSFNQTTNQPNQPFSQSPNNGGAGDYIDFEEIKD